MAVERVRTRVDWPDDLRIDKTEGFAHMVSFIKLVLESIKGDTHEDDISSAAHFHLKWLHDQRAAGRFRTPWYPGLSQDEGPWLEAHWVPGICRALTEGPISVVVPAVYKFNEKEWGTIGSSSNISADESEGFTKQEAQDICTDPNWIAYYQQHFFPLPMPGTSRTESSQRVESAWQDLTAQIWSAATRQADEVAVLPVTRITHTRDYNGWTRDTSHGEGLPMNPTNLMATQRTTSIIIGMVYDPITALSLLRNNSEAGRHQVIRDYVRLAQFTMLFPLTDMHTVGVHYGPGDVRDSFHSYTNIDITSKRGWREAVETSRSDINTVLHDWVRVPASYNDYQRAHLVVLIQNVLPRPPREGYTAEVKYIFPLADALVQTTHQHYEDFQAYCSLDVWSGDECVQNPL